MTTYLCPECGSQKVYDTPQVYCFLWEYGVDYEGGGIIGHYRTLDEVAKAISENDCNQGDYQTVTALCAEGKRLVVARTEHYYGDEPSDWDWKVSA